MNIKPITFLFYLSIFVAIASAQNHELSKRTGPIEMIITQDSAFFSMFLSEFSTRCQRYDTLYDAVWRNNPVKIPLNSKYETLLPTMPLFEIYPAFRIDCPNGHVLGIYNLLSIYNQQTKTRSYVEYLDVLSYTLQGLLVSRLSLCLFYVNSYMMDNSDTRYLYQIIGGADIMNGEIHYGHDQRRFVNRELITHSESTYVYKIQDDATLKLLSVD